MSMDSKITKTEIQNFWSDVYRASYGANDESLDSKNLRDLMPELSKLFHHRRHFAAIGLSPHSLKGKTILEIGSGAGGHAAFFRWLGGQVVATDLTLERVRATRQKLKLLEAKEPFYSLQGDAESLPFHDNVFDVVYSNGVLHHTPDTVGSIREIHRILKPGGNAIVMLYAKHSFYYWVVLFMIKGILMGERFRSKNWLGHVTEWMAEGPQPRLNPETKVYSAAEILQLFKLFRSLNMRKNSFVIQQVPFLGPKISQWLGTRMGFNPAGRLLYGEPWRNETQWELRLSRYIGFCFNIQATK